MKKAKLIIAESVRYKSLLNNKKFWIIAETLLNDEPKDTNNTLSLEVPYVTYVTGGANNFINIC